MAILRCENHAVRKPDPREPSSLENLEQTEILPGKVYQTEIFPEQTEVLNEQTEILAEKVYQTEIFPEQTEILTQQTEIMEDQDA